MKTIEELAIKVGRDMRCEFPADEWDNPDEHSQESYTFYKSEMQEYGTRLIAAWQAERAEPVYVVFDGPPSHISPKFVDVENAAGMSVCAGEWVQIGGWWKFGPLYCAPQPAAIPEGMCLVSTDFRDTVLNQRGLLADNGMSSEQINDVLNEFDAATGEKK